MLNLVTCAEVAYCLDLLFHLIIEPHTFKAGKTTRPLWLCQYAAGVLRAITTESSEVTRVFVCLWTIIRYFIWLMKQQWPNECGSVFKAGVFHQISKYYKRLSVCETVGKRNSPPHSGYPHCIMLIGLPFLSLSLSYKHTHIVHGNKLAKRVTQENNIFPTVPMEVQEIIKMAVFFVGSLSLV